MCVCVRVCSPLKHYQMNRSKRIKMKANIKFFIIVMTLSRFNIQKKSRCKDNSFFTNSESLFVGKRFVFPYN